MENGYNFETPSAHSVWDYVRSTRNDEFTCANDTARPSHMGLVDKEFDSVENPPSHTFCCLWIVLTDVFANCFEVTDRPGRPVDLHLAVLFSEALPHERSHFDTFS